MFFPHLRHSEPGPATRERIQPLEKELGFCGIHDSWVAIIPKKREDVMTLLESDDPVTLRAHHELPAAIRPPSEDLYPFLILCGRQDEVTLDLDLVHKMTDVLDAIDRSLFNHFFKPARTFDYLEAIALVPYVEFDSPAGHFTVNNATCLYVDDLKATVLGHQAHLPKFTSWDMEMKDTTYKAFRPSDHGKELIVDLNQTATAPPPSDEVASLLHDLFNFPIAGSHDAWSLTGSRDYAIVNSSWDLHAGNLTPVALDLTLGEPFVGPLHTGGRAHSISPVSTSAYGAFWMEKVAWKTPMKLLASA